MTDGWDDGLLGPDPVPGNPGWTGAQSNQLCTIAEQAGSSLSSLRGIHTQLADAAWKGVAAEAFARTVQEVVLTDLGKLHESYGGAGDALRTFADKVTQLQGEAGRLLAEARRAAGDRDTANAGIQSQSQAKSDAEWGVRVAEGEIAGLVVDAEGRIATTGADPVAIWEAGLHVPMVASEGEVAVANAVSSMSSTLLGAGVSAAIVGSIESVVRSIGSLAQQRNGHQAAAATASEQLGNYQRALADAQGRIEGLKQQAQDLHRNQFLPAARSARDKLFAAAKQGLHNPMFFDRALHDVGQWVWDAGKYAYQSAKWEFDYYTLPLIAAADLLRYASGDTNALHDLAQHASSFEKESVTLFNEDMRIVKDLQPIVSILAFVPCLAPFCIPLAAAMSLAIAADDAIPVAGDAIDVAEGKSVSAGKWINDTSTLGFDLVTLPLPDARAGTSALRALAHGDSSQLVTATLSVTAPFDGYAYSYLSTEVPKLYEANKPLVGAAVRAATGPAINTEDFLPDPSYVME
jgi:hypothetical protein